MATTRSVNWGSIFSQALAAGVIGGVTLLLYQYLTTVLAVHGSALAWLQGIAAAALGPVARSNAAYAWFGVLVHLIVSVGWAGGYAYFAQTQTFVNQRWLLSGLVYGAVVYLFTIVLLLGARAFVFPATPGAFLNDVIAYALFFGVPVTSVISRMNEKRVA
jgi:hypothetical protein